MTTAEILSILIPAACSIVAGLATAGGVVFAGGRRDGAVVAQLEHLNGALAGVVAGLDRLGSQATEVEKIAAVHEQRLDGHDREIGQLRGDVKDASGSFGAARRPR